MCRGAGLQVGLARLPAGRIAPPCQHTKPTVPVHLPRSIPHHRNKPFYTRNNLLHANNTTHRQQYNLDFV